MKFSSDKESNDRDRYSVLLGIGDQATVNFLLKMFTKEKDRSFRDQGATKELLPETESSSTSKGRMIGKTSCSGMIAIAMVFGKPLATQCFSRSKRCRPYGSSSRVPGWYRKVIKGADRVTFLFNDGSWEKRIENLAPDSDGNFRHDRSNPDPQKNGRNLCEFHWRHLLFAAQSGKPKSTKPSRWFFR